MPTCFVVQESPGKNLSPAAEFGKIQILLTSPDVRKGYDHCIRTLAEKLGEFQCDRDFLILVGDPVFMGIAMIFVNQMSEGNFTILQWDRESYKYNPIPIQLDHYEQR